MKKIIRIDKKAVREINKFPNPAQVKFRALISILSKRGKLDFPEGRKLSKNLFEIRFKYKNTYRVIYAYFEKDLIIILVAFVKKTAKTPLKEIQKAKNRLRKYT